MRLRRGRRRIRGAFPPGHRSGGRHRIFQTRPLLGRLGAGAEPWSFTTGASVGAAAPNLATASTFGAFGGGAGITNQGINTVINGDIGTTGASTVVTGFHDAGTGCTYTETGRDRK